MSPMEREVVQELSNVRSNPQQYALLIARESDRVRDGKLCRPGEIPIALVEGKSAYHECIQVLKMQPQLNRISTTPVGMIRAAQIHATDLSKGRTGHVGSDGSSPSDRLNRYGEWAGQCFECISMGSHTARDIIISLLVDDGVPGRGHRVNLLHSGVGVCGVSIKEQPRYGTVCVITLATAYSEGDPVKRQEAEVERLREELRNDLATTGPGDYSSPLSRSLAMQFPKIDKIFSSIDDLPSAPAYVVVQSHQPPPINYKTPPYINKHMADAFQPDGPDAATIDMLARGRVKHVTGGVTYGKDSKKIVPTHAEVRNRVDEIITKPLKEPPKWATVAKIRHKWVPTPEEQNEEKHNKLKPGSRIQTQGLTRDELYNDKIGVILSIDKVAGTCKIMLDGDSKPRLMLPHNLIILSNSFPEKSHQFIDAERRIRNQQNATQQVDQSWQPIDENTVTDRVASILNSAKAGKYISPPRNDVLDTPASHKLPSPPRQVMETTTPQLQQSAVSIPSQSAYAQQSYIPDAQNEIVSLPSSSIPVGDSPMRVCNTPIQPSEVISTSWEPKRPLDFLGPPNNSTIGDARRSESPHRPVIHKTKIIKDQIKGETIPLNNYVELVIPNHPEQVRVVGGGEDYRDLAGVYLMDSSGITVNEKPIWKQVSPGTGLLYQSTRGIWTITDEEIHVTNGMGYIAAGQQANSPCLVSNWKVLTDVDNWEIFNDTTVIAAPAAYVRNTSSNATAEVWIAARESHNGISPATDQINIKPLGDGMSHLFLTCAPESITPLLIGSLVPEDVELSHSFAKMFINGAPANVYVPLAGVIPEWDQLGAKNSSQKNALQSLMQQESQKKNEHLARWRSLTLKDSQARSMVPDKSIL